MASPTRQRTRRSSFARDVQDALAHLYDPIYLQAHPLGSVLVVEPRVGDDAVGRGNALRQQLLNAIERLRPLAATGGSERARRGYEILRLRYVDGLDPTLVQDRLGLGKSQYYEDHAQALRALVALLEPKPIASPTPTDSLPRALTSFIGREAELAALIDLIGSGQARLVTVTGPPGSGKTRLALEATSRLAQRIEAERVHCVDLTGVDGLEAALALVARACENHAFLLLDNCEHLPSLGPQIARLLHDQPSMRVLATSRGALNVYGERQVRLPPLAISDAVKLFVERAQAVEPDFALAADTAAIVENICKRVDALPLAVELAAARIAVLSPEAIERRLNDRLALLTGGPVDRSPRQQTLRAAVAWSYDLLDPALQLLFRRLAVFSGSFSVEAAATVCLPTVASDLVLDQLAALAAASLVQRNPDGPDGDPRFRMLETIREYARERLQASGEFEQVQRQHAEYFVVEQTSSGGSAETSRLAIEDEDNLRSALESVLREVLAAGVEMDPRPRAVALSGLGLLAYGHGDLLEAQSHLRASLELFERLGDIDSRSLVLAQLGDVARASNDLDRAQALYERCLAMSAESHLRGRIRALLGLAHLAVLAGDITRAEELCENCARLIAQPVLVDELPAVLEAFAIAAAQRGQHQRARELVSAAAHLRTASGAELAAPDRAALERSIYSGDPA